MRSRSINKVEVYIYKLGPFLDLWFCKVKKLKTENVKSPTNFFVNIFALALFLLSKASIYRGSR